MASIHIEQENQNGVLFHHTFEVKENCEWLALQAIHPNMKWFHILVKDSLGKLRMQYLGKGAEQVILLGQDSKSSSCGSVPGELPTGEWAVTVLAFAGESLPTYTLKVHYGMGQPEIKGSLPSTGELLWANTASSQKALDYADYDWNKVLSSEPRWYSGDFHMHTLLSDGKQTAEQLNEQAIAQGLDFIVITEHNIFTTGWPDSKLLVIPGVEITSSKGHFNTLGIRNWIDMHGHGAVPELETVEGMERILKESRDQGAVCSLNHPLLAPWDWQLDVQLDRFDTIEIWNDPTFPDNEKATEQALLMWDYLWANGVQLWGIGGSDTHMLPHETYVPGGLPSIVGDPKTFVWSEELSVAGILTVARTGKSYVTRGPVLQPRIIHGEKAFLPGDHLEVDTGLEDRTFQYEITVEGAPAGSTLRWLNNGEEVSRSICDQDQTYLLSFTWSHEAYNWIRAEIRDEAGRLLAFVNPVYQGKPSPALIRWSELKPWLEQL